MTDRLAAATAWLNGKLQTHAAITATLNRIDDSGLNLTVTRGHTIFEGNNAEGESVRIESRDFLVPTDQLGAYRPRPGDQLQTADATFAVFAPDGDHAWSYTSPDQQQIRIHTRQIPADMVVPLPP